MIGNGEAPPELVPWRELRPGDLAWDPADGDLERDWRDHADGGYAPLLHVGADGRGTWRRVDGHDHGLRPVELSHDRVGLGNDPASPLAVRLGRHVPADAVSVVMIVDRVADAARELARSRNLVPARSASVSRGMRAATRKGAPAT